MARYFLSRSSLLLLYSCPLLSCSPFLIFLDNFDVNCADRSKWAIAFPRVQMKQVTRVIFLDGGVTWSKSQFIPKCISMEWLLFISLLKSFILKVLCVFFHTFLYQTPFWSFALCLSISPWVLTSFISWYRAGFVVVVDWGSLTEHFVLCTIHNKDIFCCSCLAMHVYLSKQLIYHFKM